MRKIRICEHVPLDGVISLGGPNEDNAYAHGDWNGDWTAPYRTVEGAAMVAETYGEGYDLLLGRRTYDLWAGVWPMVRGGPFADGINAATKHVATHRPESLTWGPVKALGADVIESVGRLKAQDGPDLIVCGSSTLTGVLLQAGLVEEVMLAVYPVLLGRGKRIFLSEGAAPREFALVSTMASPTGVLVNTYRHVGVRQTEDT